MTTLAGRGDVQFNVPTGVAVDDSGDVYVADYGSSTIRKVSPAGVVITLAGTAGVTGSADGTGAAAEFNNPYGVAVDDDNNVYVSDNASSTIRKVSPAGVVTTLAGTAGVTGSADGIGAAAEFNYPRGVAADGMGNVYVADYVNDTIREISPAGVVTTLAGTAGFLGSSDGTGAAAHFYSPAGVAVGPSRQHGHGHGHGHGRPVDGNSPILYVADTWNFTIRKIT